MYKGVAMKFYKNLSLRSKFFTLVFGFAVAFVIFLVLTILGEKKHFKTTQERIIARLPRVVEKCDLHRFTVIVKVFRNFKKELYCKEIGLQEVFVKG